MSLEIEDGSLPANATSYVTVAEARAYAEARASTLPPEPAAVEALAIKAMDYLESLRAQFQGYKATAGQSLQWPREGVEVDGYEVGNRVIPAILKQAQCAIMLEISNGIDVMPTVNPSARVVKRRKVDVIETEYETGSAYAAPVMRRARALLAPLLNGAGGQLTAIRC